MDKKSQEFKNLIYDLANGSLDLAHFPVAESKYVENEYEEGKLCNRLYSEMRDAYDRICARLGKPDQSVIFCGQFNTCLSVSLPAPAFALV